MEDITALFDSIIEDTPSLDIAESQFKQSLIDNPDLIRDARGRIQGRYEGGKHDVEAISGRDIKLSLDVKLQQYAESLMVGKRGAVVAIEPKTGEILDRKSVV